MEMENVYGYGHQQKITKDNHTLLPRQGETRKEYEDRFNYVKEAYNNQYITKEEQRLKNYYDKK